MFFTIILSLTYLIHFSVAYGLSYCYTGETNNNIAIVDDGVGYGSFQAGEFLYNQPERTVTALSFRLGKTGSPSGSVYYEILSANNTVLGSEYVKDCSEVIDGDVVTHTFNTPINISGHTRMVVRTTDTIQDGNHVTLYYKFDSNPLPNHYTTARDTVDGAWGGTDDISSGDVYFCYYYSSSPSVTNDGVTGIEYNPLYGSYDAIFNFTLDSDGGDNTTNVCAYFLDTEDDPEGGWNIANTIETFSTGQSGNISVDGYFDVDHTYWYFIRAWNDTGYADDPVYPDTDNFTVSQGYYAPDVRTLNYPLVVNSSNLSARIYGSVLDYGGANVTAWFGYRPYATGNFTITDNTTDLITNDMYSANLTNLSLDTTYEFYAEGMNIYGNTTGSIGVFQMLEITSPVIETLTASYITASSAYLSGNVTDMGNDPALVVYFQYRELGETQWQVSSVGFVTEIGEIVKYLDGLIPATQYEYRAVAESNVLGGATHYGYGDTRSFLTLSESSIPIMQTGNATWVSQGYVMLSSYVIYDGGNTVEVYSEFREEGITEWEETPHTYNASSFDEVSQFASGLVNDRVYEYRAVGINSNGTGYGSVREFYLTIENVTQDSDTDDAAGESISDIITTIKNNLGLTGIMGEWTMLFLIEVIVALLFGIAVVTVDEKWQKSAIALSWILASASAVGGFLFSGRLGIFAVIVAVGAVVAVILMFISGKLSGSKEDL